MCIHAYIADTYVADLRGGPEARPLPKYITKSYASEDARNGMGRDSNYRL